VKPKLITYMAFIIILLGVFDGNRHALTAMVVSYNMEGENHDNEGNSTSEEAGRFEDLTSREYIHKIDQPAIIAPVCQLNVVQSDYAANFSYCHHIDVLTPPPNC
jgi:hypothetical protein